jgi:hypothetical protein
MKTDLELWWWRMDDTAKIFSTTTHLSTPNSPVSTAQASIRFIVQKRIFFELEQIFIVYQ